MAGIIDNVNPTRKFNLTRSAWLIVALLWPVAMLNYLDRQMLSAMKSSVMHDIPGIGTEANWGYMLGQFKWVYAILSPIGGYLADRFSRRYTVCASLFVWSLVTWLTGRVTSYEGILWARALMGISEAFYIPAALALITDYHRGKTRSIAVGVHQTAIYTGIILGGFSGHIADNPDLGWRLGFGAIGLVGVLYSIPLLLLLRDLPGNDRPTERTSPLISAKSLLANFSFWLLVIYFTLPAIAGWVVRDWMPAILKDQFNLGQGAAGVSATLYLNVFSLIGVLVGGKLADRAMGSSIRGRIYVSAVGMTLLFPSLFGIGNAPTLGVAVAFLILFGFGWGLFDCNNMPILSQIVGGDQRATAYGLMNLVSISAGGLADWGFGALRDRKEPLNVIFAVFASLILISVGIVLMIRPKPGLAAENLVA